jgi:hypothetical protein
MRPARFSGLVDRPSVAAIDVYNNPSFSYHEEAFSILMISAWEFLLKACILKENDNHMPSIEVWEQIRKRDGTVGRREGLRKNRTGTHYTASLQAIDEMCIENLQRLRRSTTQFTSVTRGALRKGMQEVSAGRSETS